MSSSEAAEGPMAPWAFRAALSGLPESEARDILEGERCPQPDGATEATSLELAGEVVVFEEDKEDAWLQSSESVDLADAR